MDEDGLYSDLIVRRAKEPLYAGRLSEETTWGEGRNPVCGDRVRLSLVCRDARIETVVHQTRGCAVCMASSDVLAELVTGQKYTTALAMEQMFTNMFNTEAQANPGDLPEVFRVFLPLKHHHSRIRCATLPWTALKEALSDT